ncbi:MAG: ABC transporter substrate-binding protein, partial [Mycobacterium sp.]
FEEAVRLGIAEVGARGVLDRGFDFVKEQAYGLPAGSEHDVKQAFAALDHAGVLCIIGPSISDNGLIVRDLADAAGIACINYTGGELTRGAYMFHYQVGSLEEEPAVLASHLAGRGLPRVAVVYDESPVGRGYADWFEVARGARGVEVTGTASIQPLSEDAKPIIDRMMPGNPDALVYLGLGVAARTVALAVKQAGWDIPVVANSALMFGYARPDWRADWNGWVYVDTISDRNTRRHHLRELSRASAAGPVGVAAYDIGQLLAEGIARSAHLTRDGIRQGLERAKRLPATSGLDGTAMGFGRYDHAALKGDFLVLRQWQDGRSVEYEKEGTPT